MILKVKDLEDLALDWAVAKLEGEVALRRWKCANYNPSASCQQGGPIIFQRGIQIRQLLQREYSLWEYNEHNMKRFSESSFTVVARPLKIGPGRYLKVENKPHSLHGVWLAKREESTSEMVRWSLSDFPSPNPLVSAMRCYVASEVGEEIDVPDELIGGAQ